MGGESGNVFQTPLVPTMRSKSKRPNGKSMPVPFRRVRKVIRHDHSPEEMAQRLRHLLVRETLRHSPDLAWMHRQANIPYETLRHFMEDPRDKHQLCTVNEEKLARALGHDSAFYRMLVRRSFRYQRWQQFFRKTLGCLLGWLVPGVEV